MSGRIISYRLIGISYSEKLYGHGKIEFTTVNRNSPNYGGGIIVFHHSVLKVCSVFRGKYFPILRKTFRRLLSIVALRGIFELRVSK